MDYIVCNSKKIENYYKYLQKQKIDIVKLIKEGKYKIEYREVFVDCEMYRVPIITKIKWYERLFKKLFRRNNGNKM